MSRIQLNPFVQVLVSFFKQYLFWVLFFPLGRLAFILYYGNEIWNTADSFSEILLCFPNAFKLDLATSSYYMLIPFLLHFIYMFFSRPIFAKIMKIYHSVLIFLYSITIAGEMGIYAEWKTKINYKALLYLQNPSEVVNTAQTSEIILLTLFAVLLSIFGIWVYLKFFHTRLKKNHVKPLYGIIFFLLMPGILVLNARGGLQEIPISQSQSFYSKHSVLNIAATNSSFNLFTSYTGNRRSMNENPFKEMPLEEAQKIVEEIYKTDSDSSIFVLNQDKPNIVLVILESWSSSLIFTPEDEKEVAPQFRALLTDGLYFDNIYATAPRSEQGMASIFSGFPAHPILAITTQPDKYLHLPSFIKDLKQEGYHSKFFFGGQLIYGNIKSYIMFNEFDQIKEIYDFDPEFLRGKLGIHDEFTLLDMVKELEDAPQPFISSIFTLSSHSPYDQPMEEKIFWGGSEQDYLNSAYYTDSCLGKFMKEAKKQDWYKNTLFIFVADHSHSSYDHLAMQNIEYQKIPFLFYGEVIDSAYRGKTISHLGIQTDLASTLLNQLHMDVSAYGWSKNLLNPDAPQFAYSSYEEGFSWKRPVGSVSYEKRFDRHHVNDVPEAMSDSLLKEGKAFLQVLYQTYMDY